MSNTNRGVYYVVNGSYMQLATISALSLRSHGYDGPIRCICCGEVPENVFPGKIIPLDDQLTRNIKTSLIEYVEHDQCLYLDADTLILKPIDAVWTYTDLAFTSNSPLDGRESALVQGNYLELLTTATYNWPTKYYNSSVFRFDLSVKNIKFFRAWTEQWRVHCSSDQTALWRTGQCANILDPCWSDASPKSETVIYHYFQSKASDTYDQPRIPNPQRYVQRIP